MHAKLALLVLGVWTLSADAAPRKGADAEGVVESLRKECSKDKTGVSCVQYKMLSVLETALRKDSYQVSDDVSVIRNSASDDDADEARSALGLLERVEHYLRTHDVLVRLPWDSSLLMSARNLDGDQLDLKVNFFDDKEHQHGARAVEEGRRSRLKKIIVPILVFVLLKAITLIPLFIGVLGLKAWNALQLSFFSFVISVALAIFQLCRKIASDAAQQPQIATHGGWDSYAAAAARGYDMGAHDIAYRSYAP